MGGATLFTAFRMSSHQPLIICAVLAGSAVRPMGPARGISKSSSLGTRHKFMRGRSRILPSAWKRHDKARGSADACLPERWVSFLSERDSRAGIDKFVAHLAAEYIAAGHNRNWDSGSAVECNPVADIP